MKVHHHFSEKAQSEGDPLPRSAALVRLAPRRAGRVDEADSGMAGAFGYEHDGEYLQPSGCGEQGGYGGGDE